MIHFGDRILEVCKQNSIFQSELAEKVKISKSMVNRYINKDVQPLADVHNKIAKYLIRLLIS
ncbi:MAG: helix-turn-helix transcriptional regulator [Bacteroidia bacterium]|nr:helix-turn-helix transcriptional regulator [Bacteroidia bacterium]